jgi:PadR family transcriptional regulator PadR
MPDERRITRQTEQIFEVLMSDPRREWSGSQIAPATGIKTGTLYPALLRMERFGWLSWSWEDEVRAGAEGRPRRRFYRLTGEGERVAEKIASEAEARGRRRKRRQGTVNPAPGGVRA